MRGDRQPLRPGAERARAQAIVAWRFWDVDEQDGAVVLQSPFRATPWPLGDPLRAECLSLKLPGRPSASRTHAPPGEHCRCGVYGATYRELRAFLRTNLVRPWSVPVLGRVQLWGTVRADEYSWRASFAYPQHLLVSTLSRNAYGIATALEAYGVPVDVLDLRETFSTLNPRTVVRLVR